MGKVAADTVGEPREARGRAGRRQEEAGVHAGLGRSAALALGPASQLRDVQGSLFGRCALSRGPRKLPRPRHRLGKAAGIWGPGPVQAVDFLCPDSPWRSRVACVLVTESVPKCLFPETAVTWRTQAGRGRHGRALRIKSHREASRSKMLSYVSKYLQPRNVLLGGSDKEPGPWASVEGEEHAPRPLGPRQPGPCPPSCVRRASSRAGAQRSGRAHSTGRRPWAGRGEDEPASKGVPRSRHAETALSAGRGAGAQQAPGRWVSLRLRDRSAA